MSKMGPNRTMQSVLDKGLDAGPVKLLNPIQTNRGQKTYYCPNCYSTDLIYRQVEKGVFDISCNRCHKHWTKTKK